jgi:hypothetical protein
MSFTDLVGTMPLPSSKAWTPWAMRLLAARIAQCPIARTTTYYVDNTKADDTGNGLTTATAFKTITKANAIINASSGDIAILLKRGQTHLYDATNNLGILVNKPNVTIAAYGTGAKPILSVFTQDYPSAEADWTVDGTYTNCYSRTVTNANWTGWVRTFGENKETLTPFTRFTTLTLLDAATVKGFLYDDAGTKLYINVQGDPNSGGLALHLEASVALETPLAGIKVTGSGCRVDSINLQGWGISRTWAGTSGAYGIYQDPTTSTHAVFTNCEVLYSNWHCIGMAGTGSGASVTVTNCDVGLFVDTAGTALVSYQGSGGHEALFVNNIIRYGTLPVNGTWTPRGLGYYCHSATSSNYLGLFIAMGNYYPDGNWCCDSPGFCEGTPVGDLLSAVRIFYVNNLYINSKQYSVASSTHVGPLVQPDAVIANNVFKMIQVPVAATHYVWNANWSGSEGVKNTQWVWNNDIRLDLRSALGSTGLIGAGTNYRRLNWIHNSILIRKGAQVATFMINQSTAKALYAFYSNNAWLGDSISGSIYVYATMNATAANLDHNAYSTVYTTGTEAGWSSDANGVALPDQVTALLLTLPESPTYQAGTPLPFGIGLQYDLNGVGRLQTAPSIGPWSDVSEGGALGVGGTLGSLLGWGIGWAAASGMAFD